VSEGSGDRLWAAALLLPLVFGGLFSLARFTLEGHDVPRDEDYEAAAAVVRGWGFVSGEDALAVLPAWSLRPHKVLKAFAPIASDGLAAQPLERYGRLFVVVEPDAGRYTRPLTARLGAPAAEEQRGRVRVLRFDLGGPRVRYDFSARLADAEISILRGDEVLSRCDLAAPGGRRCAGRKPWMRVTREWLHVSENGQPAVWAHPPPAGEVLSLTWRQVPLAEHIVFRGGHTRSGSESALAAIHVEVRVDGEVLEILRFPPRFSFELSRVDTGRFSGKTADVSFLVRSENDGKNHWAFDAFAAAGGTP
jgi:hypothetical protein